MLDLINVRKTFNKGTINQRVALDGINLHLEDGDFVTVIGGNGAGKSTMLNAVAGVWPVDDGRIILDGEDITALPDYKRAKYIGRVFQDPMMGTAPNMHLEDRMTAKVGLLSGGQRQALTLLMASLRRPKLLLLDEHTAALDPATAAKVLELSDKIVAENGLTAMMITHNMKDAIKHGNRLIMMNEGRIILDISGEEKQKLTKRDLMDKFAEIAGMQVESDQVLLTR